MKFKNFCHDKNRKKSDWCGVSSKILVMSFLNDEEKQVIINVCSNKAGIEINLNRGLQKNFYGRFLEL
ncbi:MAG: hypothetical protein QM564_07715 [Bergeyella sp.]